MNCCCDLLVQWNLLMWLTAFECFVHRIILQGTNDNSLMSPRTNQSTDSCLELWAYNSVIVHVFFFCFHALEFSWSFTNRTRLWSRDVLSITPTEGIDGEIVAIRVSICVTFSNQFLWSCYPYPSKELTLVRKFVGKIASNQALKFTGRRLYYPESSFSSLFFISIFYFDAVLCYGRRKVLHDQISSHPSWNTLRQTREIQLFYALDDKTLIESDPRSFGLDVQCNALLSCSALQNIARV